MNLKNLALLLEEVNELIEKQIFVYVNGKGIMNLQVALISGYTLYTREFFILRPKKFKISKYA
ncbi:hypothetical protein GCL60_05600 [Silvanigrella paludirubra]|uniref:Uncharacterized protein n=1 Tax=Silvanigrella paludirubra TaxID=2499159 RepID=A0A6N6VWD0_9BACT|nr:hypothetical protein GCL60_05600 [Silvanigrella paludirubra]